MGRKRIYRTEAERKRRARISRAKWRKANPEKVREYARRSYLRRSDKIKAYSREYYKKNKERMDDNSRRWRKKNRKRLKEYLKRYQEEHKDYFREKTKRRSSNDTVIRVFNRNERMITKTKKRIKELEGMILGVSPSDKGRIKRFIRKERERLACLVERKRVIDCILLGEEPYKGVGD